MCEDARIDLAHEDEEEVCILAEDGSQLPMTHHMPDACLPLCRATCNDHGTRCEMNLTSPVESWASPCDTAKVVVMSAFAHHTRVTEMRVVWQCWQLWWRRRRAARHTLANLLHRWLVQHRRVRCAEEFAVHRTHVLCWRHWCRRYAGRVTAAHELAAVQQMQRCGRGAAGRVVLGEVAAERAAARARVWVAAAMCIQSHWRAWRECVVRVRGCREARRRQREERRRAEAAMRVQMAFRRCRARVREGE